MTNGIEYTGARGSNAGDQFHELWALQQILELLRPATSLCAVGVEGVRDEAGTQNDVPTWDGVDVSLYYGARSLEKADRLELVQLKYSAANPDSPWTAARFSYNTKKRGNNSVLRKLADAYRDAKARMKPGATLSIRFVSNQPVHDDLANIFAFQSGENATVGNNSESAQRDLERLLSASGMTKFDFKRFVSCLDVSQCGHGSRFSLQEKVIGTIADYLGDDVSSFARELRTRVGDLMLPERTNEVVTKENLLLWFGLSSREGLFPCEPDVQLPVNPVQRPAVNDVLGHLLNGKRIVLVHGEGGCGKTTMLRQVQEGLPNGSISVNFDCYGGGRCFYSDEKRHLPENAFLQLANEVSMALQLPFFVPRDFNHPADVRVFLSRLSSAADALGKIEPNALLVVIIDAADNSVTAAESSVPIEKSFVHELARANLDALPGNTHFVFSARSSRSSKLFLPSSAEVVRCPAFDLSETRLHVRSAFPSATEEVVEQFHELSNRNPRVQSYAISAAEHEEGELLDILRPGGRTLPDILELQFRSALQKLGQTKIFERLLGALAYLPPPAQISAVAGVAGTSDAIVADLVSDLAPGLRNQEGFVSISDEDFESYIKGVASNAKQETINIIADLFVSNFLTDPYAAQFVSDLLDAADRANEILSVIESDPQVGAVSDPVLRRQIQIRRHRTALSACRHAGSVADALKLILISAEAQKDENTLTELLEKELDLSTEFSGASLRRLVLLDRQRVAAHGPLLAHDAARASRANNRVAAREQLHFFRAWMRERRDVPEAKAAKWNLEDKDIAARTEAIFNLAGPEIAYDDLMHWSPRNVPLRVAFVLVPQLVASGRTDELRRLIDDAVIPSPWNLLVINALAMAGEPIAKESVEQSLKKVRQRYIPDIERFTHSYGDEDWRAQLLDTFVTSCELAYRLDGDDADILTVLDRLHASATSGERKLQSSEFRRIDLLCRCELLRAKIQGQEPDIDAFIAKYVSRPEVSSVDAKKNGKRSGKGHRSSLQEDRQERAANAAVQALYPLYSSRIDILSASKNADEVQPSHLDLLGTLGGSSWELDRDHDSRYLRAIAAQAVMSLLIVPELTATDLEARARNILYGRFGDWLAFQRVKLWEQMRFRHGEADALVRLVGDAAKEIGEARASASEKLEVTIRLARLVFPISRSDAEALFNAAIVISKEIDHEAVDQIEFLEIAALHSDTQDKKGRRETAARIFTYATAVFDRLNGREFNWSSTVRAMTLLDLPTALAAVSRWSDNGMIDIDSTMGAIISTGVRQRIISASQGAALMWILAEADRESTQSIVDQLSTDPGAGTRLIEELASRIVLFSSQSIRPGLGEVLLESIEQDSRGGRWTSYVQQMVEFCRRFENEKEPEPNTHDRRPDHLRDATKETEEFSFATDQPFRSVSEIEQVICEARERSNYFDALPILEKMMVASSRPEHRIHFVNAIGALSEDVVWGDDRARILEIAVRKWQGTPAMDLWCRDVLPKVLVDNFLDFCRWMKQGQTALPRIMELAGLDAGTKLNVILSGIAENGSSFNSRALFGLAELIVEIVEASELGSLIHWYSNRLYHRVPKHDREEIPKEDMPSGNSEAVGRFIFSLMGDIDTRIRWRAAHAFRSLARLGCQDDVSATMAQLDREDERAFREPSAPFYFLAAKMWLVIATNRTATETPASLVSFKNAILRLAVSPAFPHVGIREYAKRTVQALDLSGAIELTPTEVSALNKVNCPTKGRTKNQRGGAESFRMTDDENRRFNFDPMDTLPYWYEDILRIFPTVSRDDVLEIAETWILDKWGGDPDARMWEEEPRKRRYDERQFGLWMNRHGELPVVERYATHLEWHAMHCAIGELLTQYPIAEQDPYYERLEYWIGKIMPAQPTMWLSDLRDPTPLERRFWIEDVRTDIGWLHNTSRRDALIELGLVDALHSGWIVVMSSTSAHSAKRSFHARVSTALVSSVVAMPLVRALQTARDPFDYRIPDEGDDLEIDQFPYQLIGWIYSNEQGPSFDEGDPCRYDVGPVRVSPGADFATTFDLGRWPEDRPVWIPDGTNDPVMFYETWCDEPTVEEHGYRSRRTKSEGWRLWARIEAVQGLLASTEMDMICEVNIDRRLKNEFDSLYDSETKRKTHDKVLLLRSSGEIEDAKRCFGTWTNNR